MTKDKLSIFKALFRGRQDVYPNYWQSKTGRKGYSPDCRNKFKTGICDHKCDGCLNQEFIPITDLVYKKHLAGQKLIGVYPLLPNNTCWFIAADFDDHTGNKNPLEDVKNFLNACKIQEIPAYAERSKSGKGYHSWIFFDKPVPAWKARLVVFSLLKEAQVISEDDSSFDRLFPNQDELSGKCLGNLIALPLYGKAFKQGNSTFLEKNFNSTNGGIWNFLQSIDRISEATLDRIISERNLEKGSTKQHFEYTPSEELASVEGLKYLIHGCRFIQHCRDNQPHLPEPLWYAMVSNLCRFENGQDTIHKFSEFYPKYSAQETDAKINHALAASGPITCDEIKKSGYDCGQICKVKAPAGLGVQSRLWDDPICFNTKIIPPEFPLEVLPPVIIDYIQSVAKNRQVPVDLPAMLALGVINAAGAKKFKVFIGDTHNEPLNLYPVIALEPGSRKTDTFKDMVCPLIRGEQFLLKETTPGIEKAKIQREIEESRLKQLKFIAAKIEDPIDQKLKKDEIFELNEKLTIIPNTPRLLAGADSTAETVVTYLYENQGRLAIIDAEGGGLFSIIAGRYTKEANLEVYLKGHSGDEIRVGRKGRPDEYIHEPALSIIITVQPDVIQSLADNSGFRSRGLLGRFLYSVPKTLVGERVYKNISLNLRAQDDYVKTIQRILQYPWDEGEGYKLTIKGDVLETWAIYADEVEKAQRDGGELYGLRDWASKLAGAVARIAGGLHLIQEDDGAPWMVPISKKTIAAAWAIGFYLKEHALFAFDLMDANAEIRFARSIWKWIKKNQPSIVSIGHYYRKNHTKVNKTEDLIPYFRLLESRNFIRRISDKQRDVGPKAKYLFELNPKCLNCRECIKDNPF